MTSSPPNKQSSAAPARKSGRAGVIVVALVAAVIAAAGITMRFYEASALNRETKATAIPTVSVIKVASGAAVEDIALPGNVQAWHEAPIFARTSGYLKTWVTDIGAPVKAGDLLAEIETPEVDAQLHQAEADLTTAQANNDLAQSTAKRWEDLLKTNAVSKQDAADKEGAAAASAAALSSAQANLDRLHELEGFKRIVAPFDGIITARNTDTGALINAGSSGVGPELFHIVETDKLRVYVQVPEIYVGAIKPDLQAELHLTEHPGQVFSARLVHTADALDPTTRTLLIELEVDNDKNELLPGDYADVHLKLPASADTVHLPVNTLLFRSEGMQVATVDDQGNTVLKPVVIARDYGTDVEVKSGISPGETIIVNPPDSIANGEHVKIAGQDNGGKNDQDDGDQKSGDGESDDKP